jgi:hypothetical protein
MAAPRCEAPPDRVARQPRRPRQLFDRLAGDANKSGEDDIAIEDLLKVDPATERGQVQRLKPFKTDRDQELAARRLEDIRQAARGTDNLLPLPQGRAARPLPDGRGLRRPARRLR